MIGRLSAFPHQHVAARHSPLIRFPPKHLVYIILNEAKDPCLRRERSTVSSAATSYNMSFSSLEPLAEQPSRELIPTDTKTRAGDAKGSSQVGMPNASCLPSVRCVSTSFPVGIVCRGYRAQCQKSFQVWDGVTGVGVAA